MANYPESRTDNEQGFTLIELLVVVLIISILLAIAIPAYLNQRKSAVDAVVQSDIASAGRILITESIAGKKLSRTVTVTPNGVLSEARGFASRTTAAVTDEFDFSGIRVSEGTSLIFQPSMIDGGVCIFGVNPGGDTASKSPGYIYDSNAGGLLRKGMAPGACASETGSLLVPTPQIEQALDPDRPATPEPLPVPSPPALPTPTPTPTPEPVVPVTQTLTEKLGDRDRKCLAGSLTVSLSYSPADETLRWTATGLSGLKLDDGTIHLYEMDAKGAYVRTHVIDISWDIIKSGKYEGSLKIGKINTGNRFMLADDDNTIFWSGYREYYVGDKDWSYKTITKNCV